MWLIDTSLCCVAGKWVSRFLTALQHIIGYSVPYKLLSRINFTHDMSGNVIKYNYVRSRLLLSYDKIWHGVHVCTCPEYMVWTDSLQVEVSFDDWSTVLLNWKRKIDITNSVTWWFGVVLSIVYADVFALLCSLLTGFTLLSGGTTRIVRMLTWCKILLPVMQRWKWSRLNSGFLHKYRLVWCLLLVLVPGLSFCFLPPLHNIHNNLKLNCAETCEVIFTDTKRRRQLVDPPPIPGIMSRQKLQMLGVPLANDFALTEHVWELTTKSAQTLYTLRVLRTLQLTWRWTPGCLAVGSRCC